MEINIVKSKTDQLRKGKTQEVISVQLSCCSCIFPRRKYQIIPRNIFSGLFLLLRGIRSLFLPTSISRTLLTENLSKRHSRGLFLTFQNIAPILLDGGGGGGCVYCGKFWRKERIFQRHGR